MKNYMKMTSALVIGLHFAGIAAAAEPSAPQPENLQEQTLVSSVLRLSGENLSSKDYLAQLQPVVDSYNKSAPIEGRVQRLDQAIADMNLMTEDQINAVKVTVDDQINASLASHPNMSPDDQSKLEVNATVNALQNMKGAQFSSSACMATLYAGGGALIVGAIFADIYASSLTQSQSSSSVSVTGTNTQSGASGNSGSSSQSGSTTVTTNSQSSSNTPNATEKKMLLAGSGVAYGLGGLALIFALVDSVNGDGICD